MIAAEIARRRLHQQSIAPAAGTSPEAVVARLGAMQAQDYLGALWAIGLRQPQATEAGVEAAIAAGKIVRTWPVRGTLHFVAAADVRWMLALQAPRMVAKTAHRQRQLKLDEATLTRSEAVITQALRDGQRLTRPEILAALEQAGISTAGQRGYHLLRRAACHGLICFGPRQGKQETFVRLDDWLPDSPTLSREEALAELARRYFTGHGPATLADFIGWSGLTTAEARAGLERVEAELASADVDGLSYWHAPTAPPADIASTTAWLLPAFDEYLLGYRERQAVLDPKFATRIVPGGNGMFKPMIVIDGRVVGTWQRTLRKTKVLLKLDPFERLSPPQRDAVAIAAEPYGRFLGLPVELSR